MITKTVAICRRNFPFAANEDEARASGRLFSVIETVRDNGHKTHKNLSVLFTELPHVSSFENADSLLPLVISQDDASRRYKSYPSS